jgi:hypothetical protein
LFAYLDTTGGAIGASLIFTVVFGLYLWLCWSIAKYAERKGENPALFFALGVLVSPIISFVAAVLVRDPREGA